MLNHSTINPGWDAPMHLISKPTDYSLLLTALETGWEIIAVTFIKHNVSMSYQVKLLHPHQMVIQQVTVAATPQADALLKDEITMFIDRYEPFPAGNTRF